MRFSGRSVWCACAFAAVGACRRPTPGVPAVELRAALLLTYPEFRGTHLVEGTARVDRWCDAPDAGSLRDALRAAQAEGFGDAGMDSLAWEASRPPFSAAAHWSAGTLDETVTLPLTEQGVSQLFGSAHTLTSQALEHLVPSPLPPRERRFALELTYDAKPERAAFIVRQLVRGLLLAGWTSPEVPMSWARADAGEESPLDDQRIGLNRSDQGASIVVQRAESRVRVHFEQALR